MKGKYHVIVERNFIKYEFDIERNITIIRGNSATGKTTLMEMVSLYAERGEKSGVKWLCDRPCATLPNVYWDRNLSYIENSIVFLDEDAEFVKSSKFAELIKKSNNYYVIINRNDLPNLPYSVNEIYGIRTSRHYAGLNKAYSTLYNLYGKNEITDIVTPDRVITEDSGSGYEFFQAVNQTKCLSAYGKSNKKDIRRGQLPIP